MKRAARSVARRPVRSTADRGLPRGSAASEAVGAAALRPIRECVRPAVFVGADIGGSTFRAALHRAGTDIVLRTSHSGEDVAEPDAILRAAFRTWGLRKADRLAVGARGVWLPREKAALRRRLKGFARRVIVLSDLELAGRAALGGSPGIVVVAGTGSGALGFSVWGGVLRAGGLGPLLGDEGSAFWIGKQWLGRGPEGTARYYAARPDLVPAVASLARDVLRRAARADPAAARLRSEAAGLLAGLARQAAKGLRLSRPPLTWHGGLFRDRGLLRAFLRKVDRRFRPRPPLMDPEIYAATAPSTMLE